MINYKKCLCNDSINYIGEKCQLRGWVSKKRHHGSLLFLHLRDHSGEIQIVFSNPQEKETKVNLESVILVEGVIKKREVDQLNNKIDTGLVELIPHRFEILSPSEILPFELNKEVSEELILKHRYLYLRGEKGKKMLKMKSDLTLFIRNFFHNQEFIEVQTPILTAGSPEGARDFVVPSRMHPGKFYALPQAPQIFKQLLMVSGVPKYFQIAPCFRDEDSRKDRLVGDFYQIDFEMSFTTQEEVLEFLKKLSISIFSKFSNKEINFSEITYDEALEKYATDKPDLRYNIEVKNYTQYLYDKINIFKQEIDKGALVRGIECDNLSAKNRDDIKKFANANGFNIAFISKDRDFKGPIAKLVKSEDFKEGKDVFFLCGSPKEVSKNLLIIIQEIKKILVPKNSFEFVFVKEFPMFEYEEEKWQFAHNPFSKPMEWKEDLSQIKAFQYDLVCNGYELASGAIRNTDIENLRNNFEICNHKEVEKDFHAMFQAFKFGVPPHGGAALGLERILMLLIDEDNVRNVVAFSLSSSGFDHLMQAPREVEKEFLKPFNLNIKY